MVYHLLCTNLVLVSCEPLRGYIFVLRARIALVGWPLCQVHMMLLEVTMCPLIFMQLLQVYTGSVVACSVLCPFLWKIT